MKDELNQNQKDKNENEIKLWKNVCLNLIQDCEIETRLKHKKNKNIKEVSEEKGLCESNLEL